MIDLHLHTVFSDGKITDIEKIVQNCDVISITDHNSIQACKFFADKLKGKKLIIGCEVTVDRAPDYLLYFPENTYSDELEKAFEKIRIAEEGVIKQCYYNLGYNQWEKDITVAFPQNQKVKNARTRDLAAIIHLYNTGLDYDNGNFDFGDLKIARKQRWTYADSIGNPVPEDIAFEIADRFAGKLVLAHPIHTAIKRCPRDNTTSTVIVEKLNSLLKAFVNKGGKYLEWEYFSEEYIGKYELTMDDLTEIRCIITDVVEKNGLQYTIGTDSHSLDGYDNAIKWLKENESIIQSNLATWIEE